MALDSLAGVVDLPEVWQADDNAQRALDVASAAIRDAAGVPISQVTATVTIPAPMGRLLTLPAPLTAVTAVSIDGRVLTSTDYRVLGNGLWRRQGWSRTCQTGWGDAYDHDPAPVAVSCTFGLPESPVDVADLCVQLATAWLQHQSDGGGSTAGLTSVKLDDAAEAYTAEASGQVSPVFIPEVTRNWLARRFGGGAFVVEML